MVSKTRWLDRHLGEIDSSRSAPVGLVNGALYLCNVEETRKITIGTAMNIMLYFVLGCISWMVDRVLDIVIMEEQKEIEEGSEK